jgi:SAM-dependent methyltransferase
MTATVTSASSTNYSWPAGFDRIPDQPWISQPVDNFGLSYDSVDHHSWYKNLEPTVAQVLAALDCGDLLVDYSSGTGILTRRLLKKIDYPVGIVNVDSSPKFLRVALENLGDDERVAFRLLNWLKEEKRLEGLDEVVGQPLLDRGADVLTSTNAIHLYTDLDTTLRSWARTLRPDGMVFVCSGNMRNPKRRTGEWIIDETVNAVNEIAADIVRREPRFAKYGDILDDPVRMEQHTKLRDKVFIPVRPLDLYLDAFDRADFKILHLLESTIYATVEEWSQFLCTYHEGVLSWVGGSPKVEGFEPQEDVLKDRCFLIRYCLERLFCGQDSFPCTWTYLTCKA